MVRRIESVDGDLGRPLQWLPSTMVAFLHARWSVVPISPEPAERRTAEATAAKREAEAAQRPLL